jgi:3-oxoacyl-[acyl-carrier protein] reductase
MTDILDLKGGRFLVTGAASGIGRATCIQISQLAGRVVAVDVNEDGLDATMHELDGEGHVSLSVDLRDVEQTPSWMGELASTGGVLSGIIHAAGIQCIQPVRLLSPSNYRDVLLINMEAAMALARGFQRKSNCEQQGGSIVFVSSVMAMAGSPGASAYALSKSALIGLAKSLAMELAPRRIRVNCVLPGFVKTPMLDRVSSSWDAEQRAAVESEHPLGFGEAKDIANAIAFLIADTGRWITGTSLVVDGGYTAH